jgi:hypothetical protein
MGPDIINTTKVLDVDQGLWVVSLRPTSLSTFIGQCLALM